MPLKLATPIIKTFVLEEADKNYGNNGDPTTVTIRQATTEADMAREAVYSEVTRVFDENAPVQLRQRWTMAELARREVYLTLAECNIVKDDGKPLFKFRDGKLNMQEYDFNDAWGLLPSDVAGEIHDKVLEVNIKWAGPLAKRL